MPTTVTTLRPHAVAFDVVETIFALDPVGDALGRVGSSADRLDLFFAQLLRDAFALNVTGEYRAFPEVANATLAALEPSLSDEQRQEVLGAFRTLDAHPDVRPAFDRLANAGVPILAVTNGTAEVTELLLDRADLHSFVSRVVSVDELGTWKPDAAVYHQAATEAAVVLDRLALVAAHAWDVHGAKRAGLITGWVSRSCSPFPEIFAEPDVTGPDLLAVVESLLALPSGHTVRS